MAKHDADREYTYICTLCGVPRLLLIHILNTLFFNLWGNK